MRITARPIVRPYGSAAAGAGHNLTYAQHLSASFPLSSNATLETGLTGVFGSTGPSEQLTTSLDAAGLAEYAGDYRSDEIDVTHTWKLEKGQLVVYAGYRRLGGLEPSYRDGFTRGGSVIDVVRDRKGRITGFLVEAGRVRHLRFTRLRQ